MHRSKELIEEVAQRTADQRRAENGEEEGRRGQMLQMQSTLGNRAVQRMARSSSPVQCSSMTDLINSDDLRSQEPAPPQEVQLPSSSGNAIPENLQQQLSEHFDMDLSGVRVHTGAEAQQSANDMEAYAYTAGSDIYFGAGQYNPDSTEGLRLLTHELGHVAQQADGRSDSLSGLSGDDSTRKRLEADADHAADNFLANRSTQAPPS